LEWADSWPSGLLPSMVDFQLRDPVSPRFDLVWQRVNMDYSVSLYSHFHFELRLTI
jgi:hypothetical protein